MRCHRRQFLAKLAAAHLAIGATGFCATAWAESLALNWPSIVLQVPSERESDKPPVTTAVAVHPQGKLVATAGDDHVVYLWDLSTGTIVQRLRAHQDWVHTLAFSPHGKALASAGSDRRVIFWDVASAEKLYVFESHDHPVTKIAWSHGGDFIAGTGFEDKLRIYDAHTRALVRELKGPCNDMRVVNYSLDDSLLAAGGRDGVVRIWKASDGQHIVDYHPHRHRIRGLEFSPDGKYIVTAGEDRQIHVQPLTAPDDGFNLPSCAAKVMSLEFFGPHHLATGCSDNVVRLWDITTRSETGKLRGHTGSVTALAHHGRLLVSGGYDTTVRVWTITENVAGDGLRNLTPLRTSRKPE